MAGTTPFLEQMLKAAQRAGSRLQGLKLFAYSGVSVYVVVNPESDSISRVNGRHSTCMDGSTEVPVTTIGAPRRRAYAANTDNCSGLASVQLVSGEIHVPSPQMVVEPVSTQTTKPSPSTVRALLHRISN